MGDRRVDVASRAGRHARHCSAWPRIASGMWMVGASLLVLAAILSLTPTADAFRVEGRPWPGGVIRYFNAAPDQRWAVWKAAKAWNESGAAVRFVRTTNERAADVVIRHFDRSTCFMAGKLVGKASIGRTERAFVLVNRLDPSSMLCNRFTSATVIAHEFGHVLGLGHEERGCALMNARATIDGPGRCEVPLFDWKCRLLTPDDVRGAVKLYGGTVRPATGPATCRVYDRITAPKGMKAEYLPERLAVGLSIPRPASPDIPAFATRLAKGFGRTRDQQGFIFARKVGACPSKSAVRSFRRWQGSVGSTTAIYDQPMRAGRYCYAVWSVDRIGVESARPNTTWVTIPNR